MHYDVCMHDEDAEVSGLNAEFAGLWYFRRRPDGGLDAAREPGRGYHVLDDDAEAMRATLALAERRGGRLVR
jgi:hypothetical protein